jgi:two-component system, LytTR family, response regulator
MSISVVIVDDEPLGREAVRRRLAELSDFGIVAECGDGPSAIEAIRALEPAVVFLDIQMPGMSGLDVVQEVGVEAMPLVVFVTAYDEFAVKAFDENAVDYLLKPFDPQRFARTVERIRGRLGPAGRDAEPDRLARLLEQLAPRPDYRQRFVVRAGHALKVVSTDLLDRLEAEDNYVRLYVGKESYLIRETLSNLEQLLDPGKFLRVRRSTIVNIDRVLSLEAWGGGDFVLKLQDGTTVTTGRTYREGIRQVFGC